MRSSLLIGLLLFVPSWAFAQEKKLDAKGVEFFESKIRPVLVQQCYQCHSQEAYKSKKLKGELFLDSRAGVLKGGASGPAVIPGKAEASWLIKALRHQPDLKMPPPPREKFSDAVIGDFVKWINMGAPDPRDGTTIAKKEIDIAAGKRYWAFAPLGTSPPPPVKNDMWARTPIDRFILGPLEQKKLTPNDKASQATLIRRAYYDLLGVPPSPEAVTAFLGDSAVRGYEQLIDRLLASEHYGERWARHWLDVARFAESSGYEFDKDRPTAYHYRDFVIKALNQDMPFDQFVRWQVAGDHLAPNDLQAVAATGFLVAGPFPGQLTAKTQVLIRYNHLDDMVATLGSAMLGLSVGCARCHEHKYDPIPQEDYYRLVACLGRTDSADVKVNTDPETFRQAKADYDKAHAPLLAARDRFEKDELPARIQKVREKAIAPWVFVERNPGNGMEPKKKSPETMTVQTYLTGITAIRLDAMDDKPLPTDVTVTATPLVGKGKAAPVKLKPIQSDAKTALYDTEGAVGIDTGASLTFTFKFKGETHYPRVSFTTAARPVKVDAASLPQIDGEILLLLERDKGQLTAKNQGSMIFWLRRIDSEAARIYNALEQHAKLEPQPKLQSLFAAASGKGGDVNFLIRGEVERKGAVSPPGFIQVLMSSSERDEKWTGKFLAPKGKKAQPTEIPPRVALASWLTDTEHGAGNLLARVIVNRLWQHHMGRGIVATPNDFGSQGEQPTHPELLDYLARELVKNGWKLKPIHKLIMTSAVYTQKGDVNEANMKIDPQNRLWWRLPPRRLEAEPIRDALLAASGILDKTMFGPGTLDANNARRSIYLRVKRSQMVPFMQMFDAPEAQQSIGERTVTTVPTQSLAFLNSPLVRKSAAKLAERIQPKSADGLPQAIEVAYLTALSRRPTATEQRRMTLFIENQAASYGKSPQALNQALTDFCQVLLCLNEFIYVD